MKALFILIAWHDPAFSLTVNHIGTTLKCIAKTRTAKPSEKPPSTGVATCPYWLQLQYCHGVPSVVLIHFNSVSLVFGLHNYLLVLGAILF